MLFLNQEEEAQHVHRSQRALERLRERHLSESRPLSAELESGMGQDDHRLVCWLASHAH